VYRCEDGVVSCQTLPAEQAAELLESGVYFQCPTAAKEASTAVKVAAVTEEPAAKQEEVTAVHPSQMDKRTKEYKEWKATQEDSE